MILDDPDFRSCGWLSSPGPQSEHVLSCRVRLARNLEEYAFSSWASTGELARMVSACSTALRLPNTLGEAEEIHLEERSENDLLFLMERRLVSQEMAHGQNQRSAFIDPAQTLCAMVGEEDHLRLQVILPGLDLTEAWSRARNLDKILGETLTFAYSGELGYLTACPTNVGTGMRCSVMVHTPALVLTRQIQKMINGVSQLGMTVRGHQGEGSEIKGNLFQISNQVTLGWEEETLIEKLESVTENIVENEKQACNQLVEEAEEDLLDRAMRAYGILVHARRLTSKETMELISPLRLGVTTGLVREVSLDNLNEIFLCMQPAHLQKIAGEPLDARERDIFRAEYVREKLKGASC